MGRRNCSTYPPGAPPAVAPALRCEAAEVERFARQFPFRSHSRQADAIDAVLADIGRRSPRRLICGDVGFGNRVARAALWRQQAVGRWPCSHPPHCGQQHFDTFQDRFADWPVNIKVVSRMRSAGNSRTWQTLVRGPARHSHRTHRLLGPGWTSKNLGLMSLMRSTGSASRQRSVCGRCGPKYVVTLTATPIHAHELGLRGLRELSIIARPPASGCPSTRSLHESATHHSRSLKPGVDARRPSLLRPQPKSQHPPSRRRGEGARFRSQSRWPRQMGKADRRGDERLHHRRSTCWSAPKLIENASTYPTPTPSFEPPTSSASPTAPTAPAGWDGPPQLRLSADGAPSP